MISLSRHKKAGYLYFLLLCAICLCSFFAHLGFRGPDLMEARNFVSAREIVENNNWLVPTMNGEIRIAKPPLPTWFVALFRLINGNTDNVAFLRLPSALSGVLLVLFFYGFTQALTKDSRLAFLTSTVLATSFLVIDLGRTGSWDIFCHSFMVGALYFFRVGLKKRESSFRPFIPAGICLGLSFLSKGPVAFYAMLLPCTASYIYVFGFADIRKKWRGCLLAFTICFLIAIPWPLYIYLAHSDLASSIAQGEAKAWSNRHIRPFWYYWYFPVFTGLWVFFAIAALIKPYSLNRIKDSANYKFLLTWILLTILSLSVLPEKKERYLLPAIIPMAMMVGYLIKGLHERFQKKSHNNADILVISLHTVACVIITLILPVGLVYFTAIKTSCGSTTSLSAITAVFWGLGAAMLLFYRRRDIYKMAAVSVAIICAFNLFVLPFSRPFMYPNPDYRLIKNIKDNPELEKLNFFGIGEISMTMIWDLGCPVKKLNPHNIDNLLPLLPFGLVSDDDPARILPAELLKVIKIRRIDVYDYKKDKGAKKVYLSVLSRPFVK